MNRTYLRNKFKLWKKISIRKNFKINKSSIKSAFLKRSMKKLDGNSKNKKKIR